MPHCSKCRQEKTKMHSTKTCEECAETGKKYYHTHKEQQTKTNKIWRSTKRGKLKQKKASNKWRQNNPERFKELTHIYTERNKTKPSYRLNKAKAKSKERGIPFDISLEDYTNLISKPCYYCNGKLGVVKMGVGLDRIDSSKGYIINNVLSCCGICNMIKGETFTMDEALVAVQAILSFRSSQEPLIQVPIQS